MKKSFSEIDEKYELEIERIVETIKKQSAKRVLLQFPDGLKPYATSVAGELEKQSPDTEFLIWFGSCFGACDIPLETEGLGVDLIIQFGHSEWASKMNGAEVI